ncbi:MAG: hypothetical protein LAT63_07365 [Marinobacter sp.]|nr:hypothetical protein [Marinobacter sp.]
MNWTFKTLLAAVLFGAVAMTSHADDKVDKALIILTSDSVQSQGMALVLGNAMADHGARVDVLLCDSAGDLALKDATAPALKPRDVTPVQMLRGLMQKGGSVNVCALYLPNSDRTPADLAAGVGVAMPPAIAAQMLDEDTRVFSF